MPAMSMLNMIFDRRWRQHVRAPTDGLSSSSTTTSSSAVLIQKTQCGCSCCRRRHRQMPTTTAAVVAGGSIPMPPSGRAVIALGGLATT